MNGARTIARSEARRQRWEARKRYLKDSLILWRRNHLMVVGTGIILFLLLTALLAPLLATHDPYEQILANRLFPPSAEHFFGTDSLGRDIYSRVVYGSRVTLSIAILVAAISTPLGLMIGVLAG
ncbi:MAG: D,D-dipeptide ABC transporter permease, partial [Desulfobacterales bacterium]|nr:D,D-dipeptide ABC transporter permease [Desulfobacterales bacterium]